MTNYFIAGYSKINGKLIYRSALTDDLKQLLIDKQNVMSQFDMILTIKRI